MIVAAFLVDSTTRRSQPVKLLLVTQSCGFVHDVVKRDGGPSRVERTFDDIAHRSGLFTVETIDDVRLLTPQKLAQIRLIVFYTTGELPMSNNMIEQFEQWLNAGGGFLGIHCATDTLSNEPRYTKIIGGRFDGHPWNADATVTIKVHDPEWAACKPFGDEFTIQEEIYRHKNFDAAGVRVLMSLDMEKTGHKDARHVPIAWCREFGKGRVFYTSLGHRDDVWTNPKYQAHLVGAIEWLLGRDPREATPNPELSAREDEIAKRAAR